MRILFVTPHLPFPPTDGGRIGCFNQVKYLSRKHEVVLVSYIDQMQEASLAEALKGYCVHVETVFRRKHFKSLGLLRGLLTDPPGSLRQYRTAPMAHSIREIAQQYRIEVAHFDFLHLSVFRRFALPAPAVLREHNVEYKIWERHARYADSLGERLYARLCAHRVRRYEAAASLQFNRCIVVTPTDAEYLRTISPRALIEIIPSGVDTEYFSPTKEVHEEDFTMAITGSFLWKPKQHNLRVLATQIFPRIRAVLPAARLYIIGKGLPEELNRELVRIGGITVTGEVQDVRAYLMRSSLVLNYLEIGGGIALKVLEAMAMRKAVLANSLGCEGIEAQPGREVVVADGVSNFAEAAVRLLRDAEMRRVLAENACRMVQRKYAWHGLAERFEQCYLDVLERQARGQLAAVAPVTECRGHA